MGENRIIPPDSPSNVPHETYIQILVNDRDINGVIGSMMVSTVNVSKGATIIDILNILIDALMGAGYDEDDVLDILGPVVFKDEDEEETVLRKKDENSTDRSVVENREPVDVTFPKLVAPVTPENIQAFVNNLSSDPKFAELIFRRFSGEFFGTTHSTEEKNGL